MKTTAMTIIRDGQALQAELQRIKADMMGLHAQATQATLDAASAAPLPQSVPPCAQVPPPSFMQPPSFTQQQPMQQQQQQGPALGGRGMENAVTAASGHAAYDPASAASAAAGQQQQQVPSAAAAAAQPQQQPPGSSPRPDPWAVWGSRQAGAEQAGPPTAGATSPALDPQVTRATRTPGTVGALRRVPTLGPTARRAGRAHASSVTRGTGTSGTGPSSTWTSLPPGCPGTLELAAGLCRGTPTWSGS